jgi:hypothetical protein
MNVGSNYAPHASQEEDFDVDEEGEGLIEPPRGRSSNYTPAEDILLCKTWCNVSMDATVGTDQSRDTYWDRMKEYFDKYNKSGIERTDRSLRSRWSTISTDCQKWAGILAGIEKANPSGTNDRDKVSGYKQGSLSLLVYEFVLMTSFLLVVQHGSKHV